MKIKTSELIGPALDWAVAKCLGNNAYLDAKEGMVISNFIGWIHFRPSTDWSQGGPIIEREGISTVRCDNDYGVDEKGFCNNIPIPVWAATTGHHTIHMKRDGPEVYLDALYYGPTALIAAMRCFCASKLGNEVDGDVMDCYRMQSATPGWGSETYWPDEALSILTANE